MRKVSQRVLLIVAVFLLLQSCEKSKKLAETTCVETVIPSEISHDQTIKAKEYADSIFALMTLEERVGQCIMPAIPAIDNLHNRELLDTYLYHYHAGGIMLLNGNKSSALALTKECEKGKIPLFISIDAEWGLGMRLKDSETFIKNGLIPIITPESRLFDYGRFIGKECKELGINMVLGPVLDVSAPGKGYIGNRAFANDPQLVSSFGIAYAKGIEASGVISVAKHFPGHGHTLEDSHLSLAILKGEKAFVDSVELRPFRDYISSGLSAILVGHIRSEALDSLGKPASVSPTIITDLLRNKLGFDGLVITDAFNMRAIDGYSPTDALIAGADIILFPVNVDTAINSILSDLNSGRLPIKILNDRVHRILFFKALKFLS